MTCYIISYDLHKQKNYDALYKAIKSYGTWAHILESTWAVVTENSASQVRDHLTSHMDSDDEIFVIKSGREAAWRGPDDKITKWLKTNL